MMIAAGLFGLVLLFMGKEIAKSGLYLIIGAIATIFLGRSKRY